MRTLHHRGHSVSSRLEHARSAFVTASFLLLPLAACDAENGRKSAAIDATGGSRSSEDAGVNGDGAAPAEAGVVDGGSGGASGAPVGSGGAPAGSGGTPAEDCTPTVVPATLAATPSFVKPLSFFFMIDRSSSMVSGSATAQPWAYVASALHDFLGEPVDRDLVNLRVSLGFFPNLDRSCLTPAGCSAFAAPGDCGVAGCKGSPGEGATGFLATDIAAASLAAAFAAGRPTAVAALPRPLECGLRAMVDGCNGQNAPAGAKCVPVLVTSGGPTACESSATALSDIVAAGAAAGLSPFVLALPGAAADLPALDAIAGVTVVDLTTNGDAATVTAALRTIREQFTELAPAGCEWNLPRLPSGAVPAPDQVNLSYSDIIGDPAWLGHVDSAADCAHFERSWYYDAPAAPSTIRACPEACDVVRDSPVRFELGCPTYGQSATWCNATGPAETLLVPITWPSDAGTGGAPACVPGSSGVGGAGGAPNGASPSCLGLGDDCGPASNESCCTSSLVKGGSFYRNHDGVSIVPVDYLPMGLDYTSLAYPATVSDFRLDRFEVTVGRFRKFKEAWDGGWRPEIGAGKHSHLNAGCGLADSSGASTYEPGWIDRMCTVDGCYTWISNVQLNDGLLGCGLGGWTTWTASPGPNETRPIVCANWYEAQAFCVWDGGFLPSDAEWNYAAAGGDEQRAYPWSTPPDSTDIDCSYANYTRARTPCVAPDYGATNDVGSESPKGDGKYGQADLGGNAHEWTLDLYNEPSPGSCRDCAYVPPAPLPTLPSASSCDRIVRGGSYENDAPGQLSSYRSNLAATHWSTDYHVGFRCARAP